MFQSAPLTEARGDRPTPRWARRTSGFNPLPSPKQGETSYRHHRRHFGDVSIRSPHRSKGRQVESKAKDVQHEFQSAPLTEARGDRKERTPVTVVTGFNPLPSPKQGETLHRARGTHLSARFNPLPSPKQGETHQWSLSTLRFFVSIRSPHRSKGRPTAPAPIALVLMFQSAPLTEARGDATMQSLNEAYHAFQSAPLTEARGDR